MRKPGPIEDVAQALGVPPSALEVRGSGVAKVDPALVSGPNRGRVIMVTAMSPTPAGEGKTTTVVGLVDALWRRGVKAVAALRQPSLGPVFGVKGGAVGGGRAMVVPQDGINLHFTGDLHAVTAAHNLLAALADNHIHHAQQPQLAPESLRWGRVLDVNDRALRRVSVGLAAKAGPSHESRFDITAASEVMAVLCMATDVADLRARLGRITVGASTSGAAVTAEQLGGAGAMAALLLDACRPNLVQTLEGNPALIHGGPFGNIAQGTSSLIQTQLARRLADVVVTEAGFAFDLGGFKFLDLQARAGGFRPAATVMVVTARALRFHGGAAAYEVPDLPALQRGLGNVEAHLEAMARLGLNPPVVAINRFADDHPNELQAIHARAAAHGALAVETHHFSQGGKGAEKLAEAVQHMLEANAQDNPGLNLPYRPEDPVLARIRAVAQTVLGATDVALTPQAAADIALLEASGAPAVPICLAKTHLSITDRADVRGRPPPFVLQVTGVRAATGAGYLVCLCGPILTMPGLRARPSAHDVDIAQEPDGTWRVVGLH